MSQQAQSGIGVQYYATKLSTYDEMHSVQGQLLPHWQHIMEALDKMGSEGLERRRQEAQRILQETGVTYNVYGDPNDTVRAWELDPIPLVISSEEWCDIEAGLAQRAELLDLVLADIYGEQTLIKKGLIPFELVYAHNGFIRSCANLNYSSHKHLILHSTNLARGPDGQMWVIDDRTQSPSGAGYALENRTVMTRIFPSLFRDSHVHRLAAFFRGLRAELANLAFHNKDDPHIVVLTPGPLHETYFEHAYKAAYLGYTLAQGDDLTVRDGKVWLKSIEGLQQVDVILRRVDDSFCDPLELRTESRLGVAGLLEAVRLGNVAIANPIGSSVLENPAFFAFLPAIARYFLGEDLKLPSVATWWCGQEKEREFVLQNLDKLVIKPVNRDSRVHSIFGASLSEKEKSLLKDKIRAKPHLYVGQQQVSFSTAPSLAAGQIEPRQAVIRTFAVAREDGYQVMPGGLTRIARSKDSYAISYQSGGISKDTWVMASEPEKHVSLWLQPRRNQLIQPLSSALPSRSADNLFWVGRYAERAEGSARLFRSVLQKLRESREIKDPNDMVCLYHMLRALTHLTGSYPGFTGKDADKKLHSPREELLSLARDPNRNGSIAYTLLAFKRS
ncbi:MAG: circularly permuted type 2 ATP-grasp protein, partial [Gammaproteobacteria bacterium]|nr:circularly permuted type 2 ATP-grasp protein [Gammaproteobacteria bacterium]